MYCGLRYRFREKPEHQAGFEKIQVSAMFLYTDIHTHILPGVDDGARNEEMCMEMLAAANKDGVSKIFLTPHSKPMHHNADPSKIRELTAGLQEEVQKNSLELKLYTGNELYYRSELLELLEEGEVCTLADSDYALIEFGPMDDFEYIRKSMYRILSGGYRPVLAHAERYNVLWKSVEKAAALVEMGCYLQINGGSITGEYGFKVQRFCRRLLALDLVHFVASDAHDDQKRGCRLSKCAKYISKKYGQERAEQIFVNNPASVIANDYI